MYCIFKSCTNRSVAFNSRMTFFQVPADPERRKLWLSRAGLKPNENGPKKALVCDEHFEEKHLRRQFHRTLLTRDAVPLPDGLRRPKPTPVEIERYVIDLEEQEDENIVEERIEGVEFIEVFSEPIQEEVPEEVVDEMPSTSEYLQEECVEPSLKRSASPEPAQNTPKKQALESYLKENSVSNQLDEDDHFLLAILGSLKRLPAAKKSKAKITILTCLATLESSDCTEE